MDELTYVVEIIEPLNFDVKFGKPFYNFSIDIIKIEDYANTEEKEYKSVLYYG
jgi:hypothetical protein